MSTIATKTTSSKPHKMSSGKRHGVRLHRMIMRTTMKIARWERNKSNPDKVKAGKHRGGWSTEGLKKHLVTLDKALHPSTTVA
jgi:hypothetical protein